MHYLKDQDFFKTSDFPLAAAITIWIPIEAVDRSNPNRASFLFRRSDELDRLLEAYRARTLRVEPSAFFHAIKDTKTQLYS